MDIKDELKSLIKGEVYSDDKTLEKYSHDASLFEIKPTVVVAPKNSEDIKKLVDFASKNKSVSLTARSGGTCMTGGPLTESVVIDMNKHMNQVKEVANGTAITEPGAFYRNFEKKTLEKGLIMPSYPASREICTVGGMVSNNSGGEKTLSYGKTEKYIEELKMVLHDGEEYTIKPLSGKELKEKLKLKTPEGKIYKGIYDIVTKNAELLEKARPKVSKNSSGYLLWNVWDGSTFNLTRLIAGSQGTLGIITEIKFKLIKPKPKTKLLAIFLKDLTPLAKIVNSVLKFHPESFESYDDHAMKLALRFLPDLIKILKTGIFSLAWQFLPEAWMAITGGIPKLVLIAEFTGESDEEVNTRAINAQKSLSSIPGIKSRIAKTPKEARKYWVVRRESFNLLRHHLKHVRTAPFIDDVTVRPDQLPEFLPKLKRIMDEYKMIYTIAGHIGDGNFHIIPLMDLKDPNAKKVIMELSDKVYDLVFEFGGSMSGEHNDGLIRTPYLEKMYGKKVYALFKKVKKIFDPKNIFNPGKKVDADIKYSLEHLSKQ